jgi:hypothetical protein
MQMEGTARSSQWFTPLPLLMKQGDGSIDVYQRLECKVHVKEANGEITVRLKGAISNSQINQRRSRKNEHIYNEG